MNLTERAETRKEIFYKLTNSADAPDVPFGGRNLIIRSQIQNGYIDNAGALVNSNNHFTTGFIDATVGKQFTVTAPKFCGGLLEWFRLVKYDADKNFLDRDIIPYTQDAKTVKLITLSDDVSYFKVSFDGAYREPFKIERGNVATDYSLAPEDLGWSTDTLVPTQAQRYLWKFEYIYYSDGSVEVTSPINISIAGADGTNGQTSHVHFAFADNATGGGFSLTTPKAYMGWYADFNESASNDPTKYKWGKWKGDQGVPGKKGDDGKTSYFHMAYADSADGKTGFSFKESGQQYQGYYTDFTQTSSTDPSKYTWMDRRAGVKVGGVNLIKQSTAQKGLRLAMGAEPYADQNHSLTDWIKIEPSTVYTLTTYEDVDTANMYYSLAFYSSNADDYSGLISRPTGAATADDLKSGKHYASPANAAYAKVSYPINYPKVKLEHGNIATDYSLAPEDTQEQIDSKADGALTQEQLNALAEKNRNVEAELAAKASLAEIEQWKQAYDSYVAQNDADKTSAEQKLITLTSRVAEWVKDWEDKKVQWSFLDTNMDFGEEGLRLGKKGSPTSILISNDRIGFYSGGSEVASMSNGTLTIDNGIFAKSLQIGHYREEVYEGDKTINVIRWID